MSSTIKIYGGLLLLLGLGFFIRGLYLDKAHQDRQVSFNGNYKHYNAIHEMSAEYSLKHMKKVATEKKHLSPLYDTAQSISIKITAYRKAIKTMQELDELSSIASEILLLKDEFLASLARLSKQEIAGVKFSRSAIDLLSERIQFCADILLQMEEDDFLSAKMAALNALSIVENYMINFMASNMGNKVICCSFLRVLPLNLAVAEQGERYFAKLNIWSDPCVEDYSYDRFYVNGTPCPNGDDGYSYKFGNYRFYPEKQGWDSLLLRVDRIDFDGSLKHSEEQWVKFWVDP